MDDLVQKIHNAIVCGSVSATFEDSSSVIMNGTRVVVRVYERYSMMGKNRVSMNVTIVGSDNDIFVSAITSGGSQAIFFKINTIGEENFLDLCEKAVEDYIREGYGR